MNSLTPQDFDPAVDFAAHASWSGVLLDQAFTEIKPQEDQDSPNDGIALVIATTDTNVGVPDVPNPDESISYTKWKRYLWNRRPHDSDPTPRSIVYSWNPAVANPVPALLNWFDTRQDISALEAAVSANAAAIVTATSVANSASANAVNALSTANSASTTATTASNSVAAATAAASAASTAATTALNTATTANVTANAANATAANALAVANGSKAITGITPGTAGQRIRVNNAPTAALEYYNEINTIAIIAEQQNNAVTSDTANVAAGAFTVRTLNAILKDDGNIVTSLAANQFTLPAGVYKIEAVVPCSQAGANKVFTCQLYNNTAATAATAVFGNNVLAVASTVGYCKLVGTIAPAVATAYSIRTACSGSVAITGGGPASIAATKENYTMITITKIG